MYGRGREILVGCQFECGLPLQFPVFHWFCSGVPIWSTFFRYNLEDFYSSPPSTSGMELRLPIWAPARVLVNLTTWAFIFLVPILYWRIFKFRNTQVNVAGVS